MKIVLTSAVERDLTGVLDWYDIHAPGVGPRFLDAIEAFLERIAANPRQFPVVRGDVRRADLHRFPYGLFYRIRGERIEVFACLHARRDPAQWQSRS